MPLRNEQRYNYGGTFAVPIGYFRAAGLRRKACGLVGIDTSTTWVLLPTFPFAFWDHPAAVKDHVKIGRPGLLSKNMPWLRKPSVHTGGTRLRSEVESRLWAWGLPIWVWSLGCDSDDVSFLSDKEVGLRVRKKDFSRNYVRGGCNCRGHRSELGVSS